MTITPKWAKEWRQKEAKRPASEKQIRMARRIAKIYLQELHKRNKRARPWDLSKNVEETSVWAPFLNAAEVVIDLDAKPRVFVRAQWAGVLNMNKGVKRVVLWPSMLGTDNARMRYLDFVNYEDDKQDRQVQQKHVVNDSKFMREDRRLRKLARSYGENEIDILKLHYLEFSREYLQHRSVWAEIADEYEEAMGL